MVFCFTFFPFSAWGKNYARVIFVFPQGFAEVGKTEKKGFWGRGNAKAEKRFLSFSFWGNMGKN